MAPIFELSSSNPNNKALTVPEEYGEDPTDITDRHYGSIGDACQRHISQLNQPDRQLWESTWTAPSGHVFRAEESNTNTDQDEFSLLDKDLQEEFTRLKGTMKSGGFEALNEAIEQEATRRTNSEDAMDRGELLSMDDLEENPGLARCVDLPKVPKDKIVYMGDTTQLFYDYFPEGAYFARELNKAIDTLNREWEEITEKFATWYKSEVEATLQFPDYVRFSLNWLVDKLVEGRGDPESFAIKALVYIDGKYQEEWHNKSAEKNKSDAVYSLLMKKNSEWEGKVKSGHTVHLEVSQLGSLLFKDFRTEMKPYHWAIYSSIKRKYAQKVFIRGVDINSCKMSHLVYIFGENAKKVWHSRPFKSISDLQKKGLLKPVIFSDKEEEQEILDEMEKVFREECLPTRNLTPLSLFGRRVILIQKSKSLDISYQNIWNYYNLLKQEYQEVTKEVNNETVSS